MAVGGLLIFATRPEGPTIHLGAMVGPRLVHVFEWLAKQLGRSGETVRYFYDDLDMRKLVVAGSAAGIAVAFRAPIGGMWQTHDVDNGYKIVTTDADAVRRVFCD